MKIVSRGLPLAAIAVALSACATSPENIKAASINPASYAYLTCPQLASYKATLTVAYTKAADSQENARTEDAVGLVLVGVPFGSASHKWTPWQISDLKGRIAALDQLQVSDKCEQREAAVER
jgi:hypothetical protein